MRNQMCVVFMYSNKRRKTKSQCEWSSENALPNLRGEIHLRGGTKYLRGGTVKAQSIYVGERSIYVGEQ